MSCNERASYVTRKRRSDKSSQPYRRICRISADSSAEWHLFSRSLSLRVKKNYAYAFFRTIWNISIDFRNKIYIYKLNQISYLKWLDLNL